MKDKNKPHKPRYGRLFGIRYCFECFVVNGEDDKYTICEFEKERDKKKMENNKVFSGMNIENYKEILEKEKESQEKQEKPNWEKAWDEAVEMYSEEHDEYTWITCDENGDPKNE